MTDIVGKNIFAGSRGIYLYKVDKNGKRYRFKTIAPFGLIGKLEKYQILDPKQVNKPKETWVLFFKNSGFIFLPKAEKNLIDVSKFAGQGIKTDQQQIQENQEKYNESPIDGISKTLIDQVKKNPLIFGTIAALILYKFSKNA